MTAALIALTTGGTGGHVFPAEALASVLLTRGYRLMVITDERGKTFSGALANVPIFGVPAAQMLGRGVIGKIKGLLRLVAGTVAARKILKAEMPALVVGFGGYASVPAMAAAQSLGIATVLHEQNAVLGRANRLFAGRAKRIAIAFDSVANLPPSTRTVVVGMPVRPALRGLYDIPYQPPVEGQPISLVILGGSQGARIFSDVLPEAIRRLPASVRQRLVISQQARPEDVLRVTAAYADSDVQGIDIKSFFGDVPERLAGCHLLITRAGSSTVAEALVAGRPTVLVPYQFAADDHQTANAVSLENAGAAWVIAQPRFTVEAASAVIAELLSQPDTLDSMARAAHRLAHPNAAETLADVVAALVPLQQESSR